LELTSNPIGVIWGIEVKKIANNKPDRQDFILDPSARTINILVIFINYDRKLN